MIFNKNIKYIVLIISIIFLVFSIYYMKTHLSDVGFNNSRPESDKMEGIEEFLLYVEKPTKIHLLYDATIGSGEVNLTIAQKNGGVVEEHSLSSDTFFNKDYNLGIGTYKFTIKRNVSHNKESLTLYYDKRYVTLEYLINDSETHTYY